MPNELLKRFSFSELEEKLRGSGSLLVSDIFRSVTGEDIPADVDIEYVHEHRPLFDDIDIFHPSLYGGYSYKNRRGKITVFEASSFMFGKKGGADLPVMAIFGHELGHHLSKSKRNTLGRFLRKYHSRYNLWWKREEAAACAMMAAFEREYLQSRPLESVLMGIFYIKEKGVSSPSLNVENFYEHWLPSAREYSPLQAKTAEYVFSRLQEGTPPYELFKQLY